MHYGRTTQIDSTNQTQGVRETERFGRENRSATSASKRSLVSFTSSPTTIVTHTLSKPFAMVLVATSIGLAVTGTCVD